MAGSPQQGHLSDPTPQPGRGHGQTPRRHLCCPVGKGLVSEGELGTHVLQDLDRESVAVRHEQLAAVCRDRTGDSGSLDCAERGGLRPEPQPPSHHGWEAEGAGGRLVPPLEHRQDHWPQWVGPGPGAVGSDVCTPRISLGDTGRAAPAVPGSPFTSCAPLSQTLTLSEPRGGVRIGEAPGSPHSCPGPRSNAQCGSPACLCSKWRLSHWGDGVTREGSSVRLSLGWEVGIGL